MRYLYSRMHCNGSSPVTIATIVSSVVSHAFEASRERGDFEHAHALEQANLFSEATANYMRALARCEGDKNLSARCKSGIVRTLVYRSQREMHTERADYALRDLFQAELLSNELEKLCSVKNTLAPYVRNEAALAAMDVCIATGQADRALDIFSQIRSSLVTAHRGAVAWLCNAVALHVAAIDATKAIDFLEREWRNFVLSHKAQWSDTANWLSLALTLHEIYLRQSTKQKARDLACEVVAMCYGSLKECPILYPVRFLETLRDGGDPSQTDRLLQLVHERIAIDRMNDREHSIVTQCDCDLLLRQGNLIGAMALLNSIWQRHEQVSAEVLCTMVCEVFASYVASPEDPDAIIVDGINSLVCRLRDSYGLHEDTPLFALQCLRLGFELTARYDEAAVAKTYIDQHASRGD